MNEPSPNLRAFTPEEWKIVAGIYRRLGELTDALRLSSAKPAPAAEPTQATLDLEPGSIAKQIAETWKPRIWGSTVKFYDEAWRIFGSKPFILSDLFNHWKELTAATYNKVQLASFPRVLSALVAAGAARRARTVYTLIEPNEDRRMAVERARSKRKEVAA